MGGGGQAHVEEEGLEAEAAMGARVGQAEQEGCERIPWAPGTERALEWTLSAPGPERNEWAPGM